MSLSTECTAALLSFRDPIIYDLIIIKQLLDELIVIPGIIKVEISVISRRLRLITLTETLIISDITKTESRNCFIIHVHCFKENNDKCIIAPNTVYFQQAMFLRELDIALGNHALRAQPVDYLRLNLSP